MSGARLTRELVGLDTLVGEVVSGGKKEKASENLRLLLSGSTLGSSLLNHYIEQLTEEKEEKRAPTEITSEAKRLESRLFCVLDHLSIEAEIKDLDAKEIKDRPCDTLFNIHVYMQSSEKSLDCLNVRHLEKLSPEHKHAKAKQLARIYNLYANYLKQKSPLPTKQIVRCYQLSISAWQEIKGRLPGAMGGMGPLPEAKSAIEESNRILLEWLGQQLVEQIHEAKATFDPKSKSSAREAMAILLDAYRKTISLSCMFPLSNLRNLKIEEGKKAWSELAVDIINKTKGIKEGDLTDFINTVKRFGTLALRLDDAEMAPLVAYHSKFNTPAFVKKNLGVRAAKACTRRGSDEIFSSDELRKVFSPYFKRMSDLIRGTSGTEEPVLAGLWLKLANDPTDPNNYFNLADHYRGAPVIGATDNRGEAKEGVGGRYWEEASLFFEWIVTPGRFLRASLSEDKRKLALRCLADMKILRGYGLDNGDVALRDDPVHYAFPLLLHVQDDQLRREGIIAMTNAFSNKGITYYQRDANLKEQKKSSDEAKAFSYDHSYRLVVNFFIKISDYLKDRNKLLTDEYTKALRLSGVERLNEQKRIYGELNENLERIISEKDKLLREPDGIYRLLEKNRAGVDSKNLARAFEELEKELTEDPVVQSLKDIVELHQEKDKANNQVMELEVKLQEQKGATEKDTKLADELLVRLSVQKKELEKAEQAHQTETQAALARAHAAESKAKKSREELIKKESELSRVSVALGEAQSTAESVTRQLKAAEEKAKILESSKFKLEQQFTQQRESLKSLQFNMKLQLRNEAKKNEERKLQSDRSIHAIEEQLKLAENALVQSGENKLEAVSAGKKEAVLRLQRELSKEQKKMETILKQKEKLEKDQETKEQKLKEQIKELEEQMETLRTRVDDNPDDDGIAKLPRGEIVIHEEEDHFVCQDDEDEEWTDVAHPPVPPTSVSGAQGETVVGSASTVYKAKSVTLSGTSSASAHAEFSMFADMEAWTKLADDLPPTPELKR